MEKSTNHSRYHGPKGTQIRQLQSAQPKQKFLSDAPVTWGQIERVLSELDVDIEILRVKRDLFNNKTVTSSIQQHIARSGNDKYLYSNERMETPNGNNSIALCYSGNFFFKLAKTSDKWTVSTIAKRSDRAFKDLVDLREDDRPDIKINYVLTAGLYCYTSYLPKMVKEKGFSIVKCSSAANSDVEIEFKNDTILSNRNNIVSGSIVLLPNKHWLLKSYKVIILMTDKERTINLTNTVLGRINYFENDINPPMLREMVIRSFSNQSDRREDIETTSTYSKNDCSRTTRDTFTLKIFGLTDHYELDPKFIHPWNLYLSIAGIGIIVIAIILSLQKRRTRQTQSQQ